MKKSLLFVSFLLIISMNSSAFGMEWQDSSSEGQDSSSEGQDSSDADSPDGGWFSGLFGGNKKRKQPVEGHDAKSKEEEPKEKRKAAVQGSTREGHSEITAAAAAPAIVAAAPAVPKTGGTKEADARPILHIAADTGNLELLEQILGSAGADVNQRDRFNYTALHWAALQGHAGCLSALLKRGADVNAGDIWHRTALHLAFDKQQVECIKILINHYKEKKIEIPVDLNKQLSLAKKISSLVTDETVGSKAPQVVAAAAAAPEDMRCGICAEDFGSKKADGTVIERISLLCCKYSICKSCLIDCSKKCSECPGCKQQISDLDLISLVTLVTSGKIVDAHALAEKLEGEKKSKEKQLKDAQKESEEQRHCAEKRQRRLGELERDLKRERWRCVELRKEKKKLESIVMKKKLESIVIRERTGHDAAAQREREALQEREETIRRQAEELEKLKNAGLLDRIFNRKK